MPRDLRRLMSVPEPQTRLIVAALREEFGLSRSRLSTLLGRGPEWLRRRLESGETDLPWTHYEALRELLVRLREARGAARHAQSSGWISRPPKHWPIGSRRS